MQKNRQIIEREKREVIYTKIQWRKNVRKNISFKRKKHNRFY